MKMLIVRCSRFKSLASHDTSAYSSNHKAGEILRSTGAGKFAEMIVGRANVSFSSKPASSISSPNYFTDVHVLQTNEAQFQ